MKHLAIAVLLVSCAKHHAEKCDKATIDAAAKAAAGKQLSLDGCKFDMQGNDTVTFAVADSATTTVPCVMKGGADAVTTFRHGAMNIGQNKLLLDVSGVVTPHDGRFAMTECEIVTHD
jgi:hypothetical protein